MKSTITSNKIKRLEKKYGKYHPEYSRSGWMFFENAIVSDNEQLVLKSKTAEKCIISDNKFN